MRFLASRFSHRVRLSCKSQGVWSRQNGRHDIRHRWASNAPTNSREGFGSFHSKDIEVLIRQDAADYVVPHEAAQLQEATRGVVSDITDKLRCHLNDYASRDYSHAAAIKKSLFCINPEFTFINHGAFGAALTPIMGEAEAWRRLCETQPLAFFDRILLPCVANSIRSMSSHLECPPEELMPLPNVTSGLNSVIFSTPLQEGDEVVCFSLTYGSTKKILDAACQNAGANLRIVPIPLPIGIPEDIIYRLGRVLSPRTKLVVLDHITSNTALRLPTLHMAEICKAQAPEVTVVVDAAHALFTEDVKIYRPKDKEGNSNSKSDTYNEDIDYEASISEVVDVWLSNGHKWLCSPKGCAFMWVSPSMKGRLKPAIISHGFLPSFSFPGVSSSSSITYADKEKLLSSYAWDGCRDYAALLTVPSLMETWKSLTFKENVDGFASCREHNNSLLYDAVELLSYEWDLDYSDFAGPMDMRRHLPMALIPLPSKLNGQNTRAEATDKDAFRLQEYLHHKCRIEVPVKCVAGRLYVRISAHIYNHIDDYQMLASAIKELA